MSDPYARFKFQDVDCPDCGEPIRVTEEDQTVICDDCGAISRVNYDDATDGTGYFLRVTERRCSHPPAAWRSCPQCTDAQAGI